MEPLKDIQISDNGEMPAYFSGRPQLENLYADFNRGKINLNFLQKRTGKNKSTISLVLRGKYGADPAKVVESLARAADEWYAREQLLPLTSYKAIHATCDLAWQDMSINLIFSPAGYGKTEGLMSYAQAHPDYTIYYRVLSTDRPKEVLDGIKSAMGMDPVRMSMSDRIRSIQERLRVEPQLLIIDEADQLRVATLNILREIWDDGNCAIIIAGLPRIKVILERGDDMLQNLAQLYRRVKLTTRLAPPTLADIREIVAKYPIIDISEPTMYQLRDKITNHGGLGTLIHILEVAEDYARNHKLDRVTDDIVTNALKSKLGV